MKGKILFSWWTIGPDWIGLNSWFLALEAELCTTEIASDFPAYFLVHRINISVPATPTFGCARSAGRQKLRLRIAAVEYGYQCLKIVLALW